MIQLRSPTLALERLAPCPDAVESYQAVLGLVTLMELETKPDSESAGRAFFKVQLLPKRMASGASSQTEGFEGLLTFVVSRVGLPLIVGP